jgi:hypothetical protein
MDRAAQGTLVDRAFVRQFFPAPDATVAFVQDHVAPGVAQQLRPYVLDDDDVSESPKLSESYGGDGWVRDLSPQIGCNWPYTTPSEIA